ncbi:cytoplasmic protein [Mycena pura]|uniref:Cytoplasmic protein n=1 Tax=Mycena pura TaxID=153505 RepID=A0AAD6YTP2_9AGAR|nr:cytoplasmic protein [Mycena pura]
MECVRTFSCAAVYKLDVFGRAISTRNNALILASAAAAAVAADDLAADPAAKSDLRLPTRQHAHAHAHTAPLLELNETEVTLDHDPIPPSYYTIDWGDPDPSGARQPAWIVTHAVFMSLAFFVCLPLAIILRSLRHSMHAVAVSAFYAAFVLACAASAAYRKRTPDMYPGQTHSTQGYAVLLVALALTVIDGLAVLRRLVTFLLSAKHYTFRGLTNAVLRREEPDDNKVEYIGLAAEEPDKARRHSYAYEEHGFEHGGTAHWAKHVRQGSDASLFGLSAPHSEETLHDWHFAPRISWLTRLGRAAFAAVERALVLAGFGLVLTGIVVYTGGCRQNYINGCLAHLIKGGIFWTYGLVSFARFLGWCSHLGWSWNRAPTAGYPTAEFVESTVIFLYGATNTWMERFGANPGDPFTTKQIQHIGIAVRYRFAGLLGMAVESKTLRKWFAALAVDTSETVEEPVTYTSSFNPFPALVIGVTGSVMAAHFQTYLFQVQIHALWGNLLLAFAVLRCLTYFFLWVAPPRSTLPSRPPTEALASFFLACGGLTFIFSTEELTIAAMRRGRDDIMMFAVAAVAITCFAFFWTTFIVAVGGWLRTRSKRAVSYRNNA